MNKHAKKVLDALKPKASKFGFNKKELQSIANEIADNLTLDDDATDEDIDSAITEAVDASVKFLKFGQVLGNRLLDTYKADHAIADQDGNGEGDDPEVRKSKKGKGKSNDDEEIPSYMKEFFAKFEVVTDELAALKSEKVTDARKAQLEDILKDTGTFGKTTLRQFKRMKFENDEEFEDYLEEVKEDAEKAKQEIADNKLKSKKLPGVIDEGDDEVVTDDFIKNLAHSK